MEQQPARPRLHPPGRLARQHDFTGAKSVEELCLI